MLCWGEGQGGQDGALVRYEAWGHNGRSHLLPCLLAAPRVTEERLAQHGIASSMASARKGIFGGQHDDDLTSLFNPTLMDDLTILVQGNTPESMLDKLSTAIHVVKEVCEENALTLNMSAGRT